VFWARRSAIADQSPRSDESTARITIKAVVINGKRF